MESSSPKRQKLGCQQVCMVAEVQTYYTVYIMDVNEKEKEKEGSVVGGIQIEGRHPLSVAFALLNSTLYMFGGYSHPGWARESCCIDLSPYRYATKPCVIHYNDFNTISPMASQKAFPRAVLIDAQVCVFSAELDASGSNFEMYDPHTNTWWSVPEPLLGFSDGESCLIDFYFVEKLEFSICTEKGSYRIDFNYPRECLKWTRYDLTPQRFGTPQHVLKDGELLVTPGSQVHDLNNPNLPTKRLTLLSSVEERYLYCSDRAILRLPNEDNERLRACIVEVGGLERGWYDHPPKDYYLRLSLFEFDHQLNTTLLNRPTFHLGRDWRRSMTMLEFAVICCLIMSFLSVFGL